VNPIGKPLVRTGDELFPLPVAWNGAESVPVTAISMGNPHCVVLAQHLPSSPSVAQIPLHEIGKLIEHNEYFPNRTNVEFVESVGTFEN
jgi:diaminopimelate epimerase